MKPWVFSFVAAFWMCCAETVPICAQIGRVNLMPDHRRPSLLLVDTLLSRHYTMNDGLPETGVNWILQDSHGFIWLATYAGLSKFDGYKFTNYKRNPGSANSLGNNLVNTLWEDRYGRLWVGHAGGLDLFDPQTEVFKSLGLDARKFRLRKDGKLWICGQGGVYVADTETLVMEKMTGLPDGNYNDIAEARDGSVWVAGDRGLIHIDGKTGQSSVYRHDPKDPNSLSGYNARSIFIDEQDKVWIGSVGLNLFDADLKSFTHFSSSTLKNVSGYSKGKLLVGSGGNSAFAWGLYSFDTKTGKQEMIAMGPSTSFLIDRQGIIWHTSLRGLSQINPETGKFRIEMQFGHQIRSIVKDANHDIWILASKGIFRVDSSFRNVLQYKEPAQQQTICVDSEGSIWFISSGKAEKYDFRSKTISEVIRPIKDWGWIITPFIDSFENVWLGGWGAAGTGALGRYNPNTKIRQQLESFPNAHVYCVLEDTYKNLWVGSNKGLVRYNLISSKLHVFENDPDDKQSLSDNTVFNMIMDGDQNIWIGTSSGLNRMIKGTESTEPRFERWQAGTSGLLNDNVYCIVDGGDGTLWLASGKTISHFDPKKNDFRNYDHTDGITTMSFRNALYLGGLGLRTNDGKIIFGTWVNGLVIFHPDSLIDNSYVPPVVITDFLINNQPVPVSETPADTLGWESPLKKGISYMKEFGLTYQQNDFSLEFAALNFIEPERNQYKYKLEPYETEWVSTTAASRIARYTNISPGKYTFRVIGSNNDGIWNEEGATLSIIITPPPWQTWWAYTLYGLALVGIFLYWRSYENKRLKLKHRAEHLSEVDRLKTRFFANISHEFRTPITLILGPLKDLYEKAREDQKAVLTTMTRNGQRLLRLINQLLDLSKLEAGKMNLQATKVDLVHLLREIAASYESLAAVRDIKYFFYPEVKELLAYIDEEKTEKVIHNLLSNAFKFTKEGGEVILNLRVEDKQWAMISVSDTGIGIPEAQLDKVFNRFYQADSSQTRGYEGSGLGMALAKELVDLHHGTILVESVEGKGTTFTVRLPLGKQHLRNEEIIETGDLKKSKSPGEEVMISAEAIATEADGEDGKVIISSEQHPVILIVEDNADMRHYIRKTLAEFYHIHEAENGKAGVGKAQEIIPDLIISDIMMPEMDGYKLCALIKTNEVTSHIPVILLTAKADRESKLAGLEFGANDYLSKPFDADELRLIVRNRIEERRKMRERFSREITLEPKQISITSLDEKFLERVLATIEAHMDDEHFSIDELSRQAGFSNMHFYRKIKALSGQTPSQFLRTIRLKRAAEMLSKNSDNVTQIAYSVGFSSLSYFNKCFKVQFGVTPGQYSEKEQSL